MWNFATKIVWLCRNFSFRSFASDTPCSNQRKANLKNIRWWHARKKIGHWSSVSTGKIPTLVSTYRSSRNSTSLVSYWNGGPSGWDFPVSTVHQWSILFISLSRSAGKIHAQNCTRSWKYQHFSTLLHSKVQVSVYIVSKHLEGWNLQTREMWTPTISTWFHEFFESWQINANVLIRAKYSVQSTPVDNTWYSIQL